MAKTFADLAAASLLALVLAGDAWAAGGPNSPVKSALDSGVISGLGARNIGSATMSGRVSAVSAIWRADHLDLYVGAASGGLMWNGRKYNN